MDEALRILGVMLVPDGSEIVQIEKLLGVGKSFVDRIRAGYTRVNYVYQALQTNVMSTLCYTLPTICLTRQGFRTTTNPILRSVLSKLNIACIIKY